MSIKDQIDCKDFKTIEHRAWTECAEWYSINPSDNHPITAIYFNVYYNLMSCLDQLGMSMK